MNQHSSRPIRPPTQAAEGLPRWRWTLAEFERFIELGILTEDDRVELIGGELVPMAAKGIAHENVKFALEDAVLDRLPKTLRVLTELGWRPDADTYCEPDLLLIRRGYKTLSNVPAPEALLVIEVADTTLKSDLTTKAALYARLGVHEYWVVNAFTRQTHVHRTPSADGYGSVKVRKPGAVLKPHLVPEITIRMMDLGLDEA